MSNLSDLMPAGASGKTIEATATATITSKAPVILNSAGTVTQIAETSVSEDLDLGSIAEWSSSEVSNMDVAFDSGADTVVVVYRDNGSSNYLGAIVGTVNTSTGVVSWGTKTVLNSDNSQYPKIVEDPNATGKFVVTWNAGHSQGKVAVFSVSGTTPSIAGTTTFGAGGGTYWKLAADPNTSQLFVAAAPDATDRYVYAFAMTYSGSTFTVGTQMQMNSTTVEERAGFSVAFDQNTAGKFGCAYQQYASPYHGYFVGGTISGTTITAGTEEVFRSGTTKFPRIAFDGATADKFMVAYYTNSGNTTGATVATLSGTDATWGSEVTDTAPYTPQSNNGSKLMPVYGTGDNYYLGNPLNDSSTPSSAYLVRITTSGTVPTWATWTAIGDKNHSGDQGSYGMSRYSTGAMFSAWLENTTDDGDGRFSQGAYTSTNLTATNFVGIADAGIATSATGTVVVQGGSVSMVADTTFTVTVAGSKFVIDGVSQDTLNLYEGSTYKFDQAEATNATHPLRLSTTSDGTHGTITPVAFDTSASTAWPQATFDSTNNKIVIGYNIAGTGAFAIVGTVSGTSISFGTAVAISGAGNSYGSITYDSDANRVVISYRDYNNSDYGTSVVGTVSGTSISFGTPVVFASANVPGTASTFDSSNNKVVIAYRDYDNSYHGTAIVGTVSGTSISFGTAVVFEAANTNLISATFDSSNNKVVISYQDIGNSYSGTSIVGTVSGTSISFGSAATFNGQSSMISSSFDTTANKVVVAYQDGTNSDYGTSNVGTVSGTSISFGADGIFESAATSETFCAYDASADRTTIIYQDGGNSNYGTSVNGTVSGTGISFDTPAVYSTATTTYNSCVYDSNAEKVVFSYFNSTSGFSYVYPISEYTTGVTTNGTPGSAGAYTQIVVASGAPTLYYYCSSHSGYGGTANTPSYDIGSNYYVQPDGTFATSAGTPSVKAGLALSTTQLLLNGDS